MTKDPTPKQQQIINDHKLRHTATISIPDMSLYAAFYNLLLESTGRIKNKSHLFQEAMECLLDNGLDWRVNRSDNGKLDEILSAVQNLRVVEARPDATKEENDQRVLDISEGFFTDVDKDN